jgi:hypothetical protein
MGAGGLSFLDRAVFALSDDELVSRLDSITGLERELAAARLETVAELAGRGVPRRRGFTSPGQWLHHQLKITSGAAGAMARLAKSVTALPEVTEALGKGLISEDQALVIVKAIDAVRKDTTVGERSAAALRLVEQAAFCTPDVLERAGHRVLEHANPGAAEERDRKEMLANERDAWDMRAVTLTNDSSGRVRLKGWLTQEAAAIFRSVLDPLCNPARPRGNAAGGSAGRPDMNSPFGLFTGGPEGSATSSSGAGGAGSANCSGGARGAGVAGGGSGAGVAGLGRSGGACPGADAGPGEGVADGVVGNAFKDQRSPGQRRHDALVELCELMLAAGDLPENGGSKPQLTLTAPYDVLNQELKAGTLDTGERLPAGAVRRLACDAGIIPAILDGQGIPLDVGRERRLVSGVLRRALVLRDRGCAFPGCDRPPRWCQGHHVRHWVDGGETSLGNSVLLCGFHHRFVHQGGWEIVLAADGHPEFIPPAWLDPEQRRQRNLYWRRE